MSTKTVSDLGIHLIEDVLDLTKENTKYFLNIKRILKKQMKKYYMFMDGNTHYHKDVTSPSK